MLWLLTMSQRVSGVIGKPYTETGGKDWRLRGQITLACATEEALEIGRGRPGVRGEGQLAPGRFFPGHISQMHVPGVRLATRPGILLLGEII